MLNYFYFVELKTMSLMCRLIKIKIDRLAGAWRNWEGELELEECLVV